jgi:hypothetical protein
MSETGQMREWACEFPPEAGAEEIDEAYVVVAIDVRPDGQAARVKVLSDPLGFGAAAEQCAMKQSYEVARDTEGRAVASVMRISVHFKRPPPRKPRALRGWMR